MLFQSNRLEFRLFRKEDVDLLQGFWGDKEVMACLNMAKTLKHISKISASVDQANDASKRILENIGFIYQGLK